MRWTVLLLIAGCGTKDTPDTAAPAPGVAAGNPVGAPATGLAVGTPTTSLPDGNYGRFHVDDGQNDQTYEWTETGGNMISCRTYPAKGDYLWVRLAQQPANQGGDAAHIDIDICGFDGTGSHAAHDPMGGQCAGKTFGIWWHPTPAASFVNPFPPVGNCTVTLTDHGDTLEGTFACAINQLGGAGVGEITDGTFRCTPQPG